MKAEVFPGDAEVGNVLGRQSGPWLGGLLKGVCRWKWAETTDDNGASHTEASGPVRIRCPVSLGVWTWPYACFTASRPKEFLSPRRLDARPSIAGEEFSPFELRSAPKNAGLPQSYHEYEKRGMGIRRPC